MPDPDAQNHRRRGSLIAFGVIVLLFVVSLLLVHELYRRGKLEDCLLSGRTNCVPIAVPAR